MKKPLKRVRLRIPIEQAEPARKRVRIRIEPDQAVAYPKPPTRLKLRHDVGAADPIFWHLLCDTAALAWAAETWPTPATNHEPRIWYQETERYAWKVLTTYLETGHCAPLEKRLAAGEWP